MSKATTAQKLSDLRGVLQKEGVDGFIVPRADEYQGEVVPACADRLKWLTGFTGSAGFAVVLKDKAVVMSDGRYTIQLKQQIDPTLFETDDSTKTTAAEWVLQNGGGVIGYDPRLHTPREVKAWTEKGLSVRALEHNPLDYIWKDRPAAPAAKVEGFPLSSAGVPSQEKLEQVAASLKGQKIDAAIITMPDSIAWMLNIRSHDIEHIPVALSYAIVRSDATLDWFIAAERVPDSVRKSFGNRVSLVPPDDLEKSIAAMKGKKVLVDERRTPMWFVEQLKKNGIEYIDTKDPSIILKARKNPVEQDAMRRAHIRDGVAVTKFLKWLSETKEMLTELSIEAKLEEFRKEAPEYREPSFDTIAGFGPNGAIVHYRATPETNLTLNEGNLLLLDSGAQYADGTTDITRTIAIGEPTQEMRERFTLVLKGHIAVASAKFPKGTKGMEIDELARAALKEKGLDYAHGTGHGVGCYLSVHEEAASISTRGVDPIEVGMIISNEPGYYKEGEYGIRIENLILAREEGKEILSFETLTFVPMDLSLVVPEMLTVQEAGWLKNYHKDVFEKLSPHLDVDTKTWLQNKTAL